MLRGKYETSHAGEQEVLKKAIDLGCCRRGWLVGARIGAEINETPFLTARFTAVPGVTTFVSLSPYPYLSVEVLSPFRDSTVSFSSLSEADGQVSQHVPNSFSQSSERSRSRRENTTPDRVWMMTDTERSKHRARFRAKVLCFQRGDHVALSNSRPTWNPRVACVCPPVAVPECSPGETFNDESRSQDN